MSFNSYTYPLKYNLPPGLLIYHDAREYDKEWFDLEQRNGTGVKFVIEAGYFSSLEERDAFAATIDKVKFTNVTKGVTYTIKSAFKYIYTTSGFNTPGVTPGTWVWVPPTPTYTADYSIVLSNSNNFIGHWDVELVAHTPNIKGKHIKTSYTSSFDLDQDMIFTKPIIEITNVTISAVPASPAETTGYSVCFEPKVPVVPGTANSKYKVRIVDINDISYDSPTLSYSSKICHTIPAAHYGKQGRVEARLFYGFYLSCPDNVVKGSNGIYGQGSQQSRNSTYFLLEP